MDEQIMNDCFNYVYQLTLECGELVKEGASKTKVIETKEHKHDVVTEYDKKVEEILMNGIKKKFPDHKFIAEESSYGNVLPELTDSPTWIIDPIDGTQNFTRNIRLVCISIGLVVNKQIVLSILYNPCMDEMYTAKKGQGAFLNNERIHVSSCKTFSDALFCFTLIPRRGQGNLFKARILEFMKRSNGFRIFGSVALTLCFIASGLMDAYSFENVMPWDVAGGILLIEEAGGFVKHKTGKSYDLMEPNLVVAATEELCDEMIGIINDIEVKNSD
uniref:Inositol-1-monophosphatase n=1 Tax=Culicoides sonorensis TaxID=179676 RepID=A0A336MXY0_CULSO